MTNELYHQLDDLIAHNKDLTLRLKLADTEIANLKIEVRRLEDGQLELKVKLADSQSEVGQMVMKLKHRSDALANIKPSSKFEK